MKGCGAIGVAAYCVGCCKMPACDGFANPLMPLAAAAFAGSDVAEPPANVEGDGQSESIAELVGFCCC